MYQIAVCDDEEAIRSQIIRVLAAHPRRDDFTVTEFTSGEALLDRLHSGQTYFLLILDIELQAQSGVAVGKRLRDELRDNATQVLSALPQPDFFQIHQSFVVNDRFVRYIRYDRLSLDDGTELSISQHFRKQVRELLFRRIPKGGELP